MDFTQLLNSDTGKEIIDGISQKAGTSENETKSVVNEGVPVLLGMLKQNSSSEEGGAGILNALKQHDGSVLDNISGFFGNSSSNSLDGSKILGHILGGNQNSVENAISKKSGVSLSSVQKILPLLAPLVMGYLGKNVKNKGGTDLGGILGGLLGGGSGGGSDILSSVLGGLTGGNQKSGGGLGGMLGGLLGKK